MTSYLDTLLRKRGSLLKVTGLLVAMVTVLSVAMMNQLHHVTDMQQMAMDYDFDSKRGYHDYNPLSNDVDGLNFNGQPLSRQRRDTLAVKQNSMFRNREDVNQDQPQYANRYNEKPLRKIIENGIWGLKIQRNKEFLEKQNRLEKLRNERKEVDEIVDDEIIVDDESDSDYVYQYENDNPVFKAGDFDLPEHFYEAKVKFVDANKNVKSNNIAHDVSYYDDDVGYDDDDSDEEPDESVKIIMKNEETNENHHGIHKQPVAIGNASVLSKKSETNGKSDVENLLRSVQRASEGDSIPDPCREAQNCRVSNEFQKARSNGKTHANRRQNNRANLDKFHRSNYHFSHKNVTFVQRNNRNEKNISHNATVVDRAHDENSIETQIPVHDDLGAVAMEYPGTQMQPNRLLRQQVDLHNAHGMPIVVSNIFWSNEALAFVPSGITEEDFQQYLTRVSRQQVTVMRDPKWNQCGRLQNQYVQLGDGTDICARYRLPHLDLVQGEILSFYLSRFLGMDNVPPVVLARVDTNATQWRHVARRVQQAGWQHDSLVALILWIDNIESREHMPSVIVEAFESNSTLNSSNSKLSSMTSSELADVIQWTDLILFDYLTGNYDRVASMQDGAEKEHKPSIMHESIRNLRKDKASGRLWFIDNESGLLDAYELMYAAGRLDANRFVRFHKKMLKSICIFNPKTAAKIRQLTKHPAPHDLLVNYAKKQDSLYRFFPPSKSLDLFQKYFHTRLKEVTRWLAKCESVSSSNQ